MRHSVLFISLLIFSLSSAIQDPVQEKKTYYKDGILAIAKWYGNHQKIDSLKTYYKTGELDEAFYFNNGRFNGASFKYNKAGNKVTTWRFEHGKLMERTDHILEFNKKDEGKIKTVHKRLIALNSTLKSRPQDIKLHLARAHIRLLLGDYTLALHDFSFIEKRIVKTVELKKVDVPNKLLANIYDARAGIHAYYEMENFATHYKYKAFQADPDDKRLIYNLGSYLYSIKSYRLAEHYLNKALEKRPDHEFTHRALAALYTDFEDYEKALHHVSLAFAQESNLIKYGYGNVERDIRTLRGFIYHKLGEPEKGIADLKEAIRLNKDNSFAHRNLGVLYHDLGDQHNACDFLKKAKELGYEKTHDRYDLERFLEFSCANKKVVALPKLSDSPFVHPNPTKGLVTIKNFDFDNLKFEIYNFESKLMKRGIVEKRSVDFSGLPPGLYILRINAGADTPSFKIVKE